MAPYTFRLDAKYISCADANMLCGVVIGRNCRYAIIIITYRSFGVCVSVNPAAVWPVSTGAARVSLSGFGSDWMFILNAYIIAAH